MLLGPFIYMQYGTIIICSLYVSVVLSIWYLRTSNAEETLFYAENSMHMYGCINYKVIE